jgi:D-cysteine desulfhydrase
LRGEPVALVPTGGTSVLGALGYLNAGLELAEQVRAGLLPEPAAIFVALGSGGTGAGLIAGLRLGGLASRLIGVRVSDILPPSPHRLLRMARACLTRFAPDRPLTLSPRDVEIDGGFIGAGYGAPTDAGEAAARLLAEHQGIALETTYTAKCLAALLARAGEPGLRQRPLLFWNTFSSVEPALPGGVLPDPATLPREFRRFF